MNDLSDKPSISQHQQDLHDAFEWVLKTYEQGHALLAAVTETMVADGQLQWRATSTCSTMSGTSAWHFAWMDVQWYSPSEGASPDDSLAFVAIDYHSHRVGTYLHVGTCTVDPRESTILENPQANAHHVVNLTARNEGYIGNDKLFDCSALDGPVVKYTPVKDRPLNKKYAGVENVTSGSLPIAWIEDKVRLSEILDALKALYDAGDSAPLAAVCLRATADLDADREGAASGKPT